MVTALNAHNGSIIWQTTVAGPGYHHYYHSGLTTPTIQFFILSLIILTRLFFLILKQVLYFQKYTFNRILVL